MIELLGTSNEIQTYLDVGCYFGWFVAKMCGNGYDAYGIERDPIAVAIGQVAYGIDTKKRITVGDCFRVLQLDCRQYDVVSCLSVLHHFVLGKASVSAEEFLGALDNVTRKVLFIDTGESTEAWFRESLKDWTPDFIEKWLIDNSTFSSVVRIHVDEDRVPPYENNYGRTLFACLR
jgi:hypothetical protein